MADRIVERIVHAPRAGVNDGHHDTAERFLDALAPTQPRWMHGRWIFRGHANAEWELKASAVRDTRAFDPFDIRLPTERRPAWSVREDRVRILLAHFARRLDEAGISIPSESPRVVPLRASAALPSAADREVYPLMALAQHHGLPTLLLDWTRRSRFAAYFAAAGVAGKEGDPVLGTHLAVWALQTDFAMGSFADLGPRPGDGVREGTYLEEYQAPSATNPNMRAQAGLFTILTSPDDSSIERHFDKGFVANGLPSPLWRLTLPHAEARKLMQLLAYEGIDGASMFPGSDGVVKAMRESAIWNEPTTMRMAVRRDDEGSIEAGMPRRHDTEQS